MFRRVIVVVLLLTLVFMAAGCRNKNVKNPLADVSSKQPDKVLFDRAMDAMQKRKYDVARLSLQTLINTYPDSEFVARAKLGIGDAWLAEGGSTALAQAENEYKDFITFFPNMPEAAEAQLKVADIHYKQMQKADRDYTHAKRAEDEYRQVLLQYPDSKLADQARVKLLEVQEVLADREFRIGRFYFLRGSWAAAIARLRTLADTYPLYSGADETLFMLGQAAEAEAKIIRSLKLGDAAKNRLIRQYEDDAAAAYSKIVTRYPAMPRFEDAKKKLAELDRPVPTPTPEAIDLNKKEMASRSELTRMARLKSNLRARPDVSRATKVGEPTLVDPKQTDAPALIKQANEVVANANAPANGKVTVETVKDGKVPESQPTPRSDNDTPKPAPEQVNEAAGDSGSAHVEQVPGDNSSNTAPAATAPTTAPKAATDAKAASTDNKDSAKKDENTSSSKEKKKKGLRKLIPF